MTPAPAPAFGRQYPVRSLSENPVRDLILDIQSKSGPKREGSFYTRHSIQNRGRGYFTTFYSDFTGLAREAMHKKQEVKVLYKGNGRWKDIVSIRAAEPLGPESQDNPSFVDEVHLPI